MSLATQSRAKAALIGLGVLSVALFGGHAAAQPKSGDAQPNRIDVGTIYTGATVEASFLVYERGTNAKIPLTVTVPPFVIVRSKTLLPRQLGPGNDYICGDIVIAIDTTSVGELSGQISVTLGQATTKVPVHGTVKQRRPEFTRLLMAETPFTRFSTEDGLLFKAWTDLVQDAPLDVSYLTTTRGQPVLRDLDLRRFDTVLLACEGLDYLIPEDIRKVRQFAEGGGRVVVAANHFFGSTVNQANQVLAGYGIQVRDEEAGGGRNAITMEKGDLTKEVLSAGVKSLYFSRASPVAVTDPKKGRVLVKALGVGQAEDGFVASAQAGRGTVIALGQSLWWSWITEKKAAGADNAKLLRWLLLPPSRAEL